MEHDWRNPKASSEQNHLYFAFHKITQNFREEHKDEGGFLRSAGYFLLVMVGAFVAFWLCARISNLLFLVSIGVVILLLWLFEYQMSRKATIFRGDFWVSDKADPSFEDHRLDFQKVFQSVEQYDIIMFLCAVVLSFYLFIGYQYSTVLYGKESGLVSSLIRSIKVLFHLEPYHGGSVLYGLTKFLTKGCILGGLASAWMEYQHRTREKDFTDAILKSFEEDLHDENAHWEFEKMDRMRKKLWSAADKRFNLLTNPRTRSELQLIDLILIYLSHPVETARDRAKYYLQCNSHLYTQQSKDFFEQIQIRVQNEHSHGIDWDQEVENKAGFKSKVISFVLVLWLLHFLYRVILPMVGGK